MNFFRVENKNGSHPVGYWIAESEEAALNAMVREVTGCVSLAQWAEEYPEECGDVEMWHAEEAGETCAMADGGMAVFTRSYEWQSAPLVGNERAYFRARQPGWYFVFIDDKGNQWSDGYIDVPRYATPEDMLVAALEAE